MRGLVRVLRFGVRGGAEPQPLGTAGAESPRSVVPPAAGPVAAAIDPREALHGGAEPARGSGGARFLKGQTHVHTSGSYDSKAPPKLVLSFYVEHGYDFVAI